MNKDILNEDGSIDWEKYNAWSREHTKKQIEAMDARFAERWKRLEEKERMNGEKKQNS
jgi:hypothetical protein